MEKPRILILIPELKEVEPDDNLATISTAKELEKHYDRLGYPHDMRHFEYVPAEFRKVVEAVRPDCIFNLVESVSGTSRLLHVPPIYIEEINLPYTGSPSHALELSNDKVLAKKILNWLDLPTPAWGTMRTLQDNDEARTWIVKAQHEHASFGLSQRNVVKSGRHAVEVARQLTAEHRIPWIIEEFVAGREFNVSVVETPQGPRTLPVAEIVFENYGADLYNIVDYAAKWSEQSFEYRNTVRRYDFAPGEQPLLQRLQAIAVETWKGFDLRGWARVDFRVDGKGNPFVVDVNANPDLSLDAGFMAAAGRQGISPEEAIRMITDAAFAVTQ
jgi:D-alanine-D-alanine ligase